MKRTGRHPEKALTAVRVRALREAGRYTDGNGLYLVVEPSGAKRWLLRTVVQSRRRDIGLGGTQLVSLAEAREAASRYRKIAREGGDPLAEKHRSQIAEPTFREAVEAVHAERRSSWKNPKHAAQWINTLTEYACPIIGEKRVSEIETPDVLRVLAPIWLTKPETARRLKQRIGTVFDWANAAGFRSRENPVLGVSKGLPRQPARVAHHEALPFTEVPAFMQRLAASQLNETTKLAFELLILTATRTSEILRMTWDEIDRKDAVWAVPAARTKTGRDHRVPLVPRALEILDRAEAISTGGQYVFAGRRTDQMSNMVFLMALRRMGLEVTAHGFRSSFRDWASERTNFSREVCEMALGHSVRDKTEGAYRRGDLFDKRRALMEEWTSFTTSGQRQIPPSQTHDGV